MQFISDNLWLIWTIVAIVCLTMEMMSGDFFITCFAIGALGGVITSLIGASFWVQVLVFAVVSILSVRLLRPRLLAALEHRSDKRVSNADALMGRIGVVTETIRAGAYGRVKIDGDDWKAETDAREDIVVGEKVKVVGRESIIIKVEVV
ncbi:MAG: NfeD family protein [Prevotella sp.]